MGSYTVSYGATAGAGSSYGTLTWTIPAFTVPAGEKFKRFKVTKNNGNLTLKGGMASVGWDSWTTDTTKISWTNGSTSKVSFYNNSSSAVSVRIVVTFETDTLPTYNVTCRSNGNGTLSASPSNTYQGNTVTLSPSPSTGYKLSSYSSSPSVTISSNKFTMPNSAITITATFAKKSYAISVVASPSTGGTVTGSGTYNYASSVSITATAKTGYHFVRWSCSAGSVASATSASTTFTVPASTATVTATFEKDLHTLTLNGSPAEGGIVLGGGTYSYGDTVTIQAVMESGYLFNGWVASVGSVANAESPKTTYVITEDATITATFVEASNVIEVRSGDISWETGNGYITISCNMINESEITTETIAPATITLRLGVIE